MSPYNSTTPGPNTTPEPTTPGPNTTPAPVPTGPSTTLALTTTPEPTITVVTNPGRIGDFQEVENKNPHWKASPKYIHLRAQFPDGEERYLLFTAREIQNALERATKNPEDLIQASWLKDLFD